MNRISLALLAGAALVVASCGGDDDDADDPQAVTDAFTAVFDSDVPFDDKAANLENASALEAAVEAYADAGSAMGGITLEATDVVIDGDTATVTYDVLFGGAPAYEDLSKTITRSDGEWIVPQAAFCEFLSSARVACP